MANKPDNILLHAERVRMVMDDLTSTMDKLEKAKDKLKTTRNIMLEPDGHDAIHDASLGDKQVADQLFTLDIVAQKVWKVMKKEFVLENQKNASVSLELLMLLFPNTPTDEIRNALTKARAESTRQFEEEYKKKRSRESEEAAIAEARAVFKMSKYT